MRIYFLLYNFASAIRFDLHVLDDERCFIEELPKETQQFWNYRVEYYDAMTQTHTLTPAGFGLRVHVKREAYGLEAGGDTTLLSKVYGNEGQFTYTVAENGKHKICFKAEASNAQMFDKYRLVIHKRRGHDQSYFQSAAKEEDLTEVGVRITKILDQLQQISSEQQFSKYREATFRKTSNHVNSMVFWWGIIQIMVLVGTRNELKL